MGVGNVDEGPGLVSREELILAAAGKIDTDAEGSSEE
jgi:hypothetical protein